MGGAKKRYIDCRAKNRFTNVWHTNRYTLLPNMDVDGKLRSELVDEPFDYSIALALKGFHMTMTSLGQRLLSSAFLSMTVVLALPLTASASEFDQKAPEFDSLQTPVQMTETEVQKAVLETMKRQCDAEGRCWLMGTDSSGSSWQLSFNAGVGSRNYASGTTVINLGDEGNNSNSNDPYYGFSVTYRRYNCETNLRVSPAMKRLLETYQYMGVNPDGSTKRTFSPADLALFSLYATLNQKLETCRQNGQQ